MAFSIARTWLIDPNKRNRRPCKKMLPDSEPSRYSQWLLYLKFCLFIFLDNMSTSDEPNAKKQRTSSSNPLPTSIEMSIDVLSDSWQVHFFLIF